MRHTTSCKRRPAAVKCDSCKLKLHTLNNSTPSSTRLGLDYSALIWMFEAAGASLRRGGGSSFLFVGGWGAFFRCWDDPLMVRHGQCGIVRGLSQVTTELLAALAFPDQLTGLFSQLSTAFKSWTIQSLLLLTTSQAASVRASATVLERNLAKKNVQRKPEAVQNG